MRPRRWLSQWRACSARVRKQAPPNLCKKLGMVVHTVNPCWRNRQDGFLDPDGQHAYLTIKFWIPVRDPASKIKMNRTEPWWCTDLTQILRGRGRGISVSFRSVRVTQRDPVSKGGEHLLLTYGFHHCIGMYTHVQSHKIQTPEHRRICIPLQINPAYVYPSK